jgi:hypothetical protein
VGFDNGEHVHHVPPNTKIVGPRRGSNYAFAVPQWIGSSLDS